jgi:putative FmdB family regulatory protein
MDGKFAMVVLSANRKVILQDLRDITGSDRVGFASETEFKERFPDCEPGAMPPFGNLYGMEVFVAPELAQNDEIAFNAGTHTEVVRLAYRDFERLVHSARDELHHLNLKQRGLMPTYEYECNKCGKEFTVTTTISEHERKNPKCPECSSTDVEHRIEEFFR